MRYLTPVVAIAAIFLSGCELLTAVIERQAISKDEFSFNRAEFTRVDIPFITPNAKAEFKVVLGVKNPNPVAAVVDKLDYELLLQDQSVSSGALSSNFRVEAGGNQEMVLPFSITYDGLTKPVLDAFQAREVAVGVKGMSHLSTPVGTLDFPMQVAGRSTIDQLLQLPLPFTL